MTATEPRPGLRVRVVVRGSPRRGWVGVIRDTYFSEHKGLWLVWVEFPQETRPEWIGHALPYGWDELTEVRT